MECVSTWHILIPLALAVLQVHSVREGAIENNLPKSQRKLETKILWTDTSSNTMKNKDLRLIQKKQAAHCTLCWVLYGFIEMLTFVRHCPVLQVSQNSTQCDTGCRVLLFPWLVKKKKLQMAQAWLAECCPSFWIHRHLTSNLPIGLGPPILPRNVQKLCWEQRKLRNHVLPFTYKYNFNLQKCCLTL